MIIKSQGNKQADKEWEVGDEEACVRTPGRCPSVAECQLSTCIEELLAPPPDRLSTRHFVSSSCAPWGNSGPHFTSSVSAAFFIFLLPDLHRKSLLPFSLSLTFTVKHWQSCENWVLMKNKPGRARPFPPPFLPSILKPDLGACINYVIAYRHTLK